MLLQQEHTFYNIKVIIQTIAEKLWHYDELIGINHNPNWPYIPDYLFTISNIDGSELSKTNLLLNLIREVDPDKKIYMSNTLWTKVSINRRKKVEVREYNDPKAYIDYSLTIDDEFRRL